MSVYLLQWGWAVNSPKRQHKKLAMLAGALNNKREEEEEEEEELSLAQC